MTTPEIYTKGDLVRHMQSNGSHFFDPETMRFFNSRLLGPIVQKGELVYFITSERFDLDRSPRKYTIRKLKLSSPNATVCEIGEFQQYHTVRDARKALKDYLATLA